MNTVCIVIPFTLGVSVASSYSHFLHFVKTLFIWFMITYVCICICVYIYVYIYIYISLVLCLSAGPWHPCSPLISILSPSFHCRVTPFLQVVNHSHSWSFSQFLTNHPSLYHEFQQTVPSYHVT